MLKLPSSPPLIYAVPFFSQTAKPRRCAPTSDASSFPRTPFEVVERRPLTRDVQGQQPGASVPVQQQGVQLQQQVGSVAHQQRLPVGPRTLPPLPLLLPFLQAATQTNIQACSIRKTWCFIAPPALAQKQTMLYSLRN